MWRARTMTTRPALLALLLLSAPARAEPPDDRLEGAIAVEYVIANCNPDTVQVFAVGVARMIIDGSSPADVARIRAEFRQRIEAKAPTRSEACAILEPEMPKLGGP